ncbi:glucose-6-phosphate isomerase [Ostreibacterium oceani]|uniref:Glucose-6-phosphate isomerase n=1 Tax=Ostreibacterium oceani TaxID=2654998 RepID=A0A6N7EXH3_9GAMM|nr:glucose-6-phosphate isomerase [Ostreibacterium oceani]MPV86643.1 glucose-6-phosphate isomerase [Ostreibacterium oceani]
MDKIITQQLTDIANTFRERHLCALFEADPSRGRRYYVETANLWLNYSRNHLDDSAIEHLLMLANKSALDEKRQALFSGETLNQSETRAAKHTLLRAPLKPHDADSVEIHQVLKQMASFVADIQSNQIIADTVITDVVCIGIGGSELGTRIVHQALSASMRPRVQLHFLANIDGTAAKSVMRRVTKESTLFLITSKTFTTIETLQNFATLKAWFTQDFTEQAFMKRCYAITANPDAAIDLKFENKQIFKFWDWVGGRFSLWSAVGLPIAIAYGMETFSELLAGANQMDGHFLHTPFHENLPVMLALIHIWYGNFLGYPTRAVIPYAQKLEKFPAYLQQLEMESLGKSIDIEGQRLQYPTSPIIWGSAGSNGQHAFFQLLHQGSQIVPVDFIAALEPEHEFVDHHNALLANCLAQSQTLMTGGAIDKKEHGHFNGNRPSNFILMQKLTPFCLGQLLALYEHKVFTQSVIWNINAFDQWGVELGKRIASDILAHQTPNRPMTFADIQATFSHPHCADGKNTPDCDDSA